MEATGRERVSKPILTNCGSEADDFDIIKLCVIAFLSSQLFVSWTLWRIQQFCGFIPRGLSTSSSKMVHKVAAWNLGGTKVKFRKTEQSKNQLNTSVLQLTNNVARNDSFKIYCRLLLISISSLWKKYALGVKQFPHIFEA